MNRASAYFQSQSQAPPLTNKSLFYKTLLEKCNAKDKDLFANPTKTQMVSKDKQSQEKNDMAMRKIINELFET